MADDKAQKAAQIQAIRSAQPAATIAQPTYGPPRSDAQLMQLTQPQPGMAGFPLPPTSPIQPTLAPDSDAWIGQEMHQRVAGADAIRQQLTGLQQREQAEGIPSWRANDPSLNLSPEMRAEVAKYGLPRSSVTQEPWMKMDPVTGHGFFGGLVNAVKDIGRGALAGVAATGPGQAIQAGMYGPRTRTYEAGRQATAEQIANLRAQTQLEEQPISALGELLYHNEMIRNRNDLNNIREQLYQEKAENDRNRTGIERQKLELAGKKFTASRTDADRNFQAKIANLNLNRQKLGEQEYRDGSGIALREYGETLTALRIQAGYDEQAARQDTAIDIANARLQAEHPAQRLVTSVPQAQRTSRQPLNLPPAPNLGGGGQTGVQVRDPRGVMHTFPDQKSADAFKNAAGIR